MKSLIFFSSILSLSRALPAPVSSNPLRVLQERSCTALTPTYPSTYWYEEITHDGTSPFIQYGSTWQVYRNVQSSPFNAVGNGATDDSTAIQDAINLGNQNGNRAQHAFGTTGQPAVVYLPAGTYILDSPLQLYLGTILTGDPLNPPIIKASSSFSGDYLIYGKDPYYSSATLDFFVAINNVILDSTNINADTTFTLLDWSISQGCQLTNVVFNMPDYSTGHTGVGMPEGGSPTIINDVAFYGGAYGINVATQQYHFKNLTFVGCNVGIYVSSVQDLVIQGSTFTDCGTAISTTSNGAAFVAVIDSKATNTGAFISIPSESSGYGSVVLENIQVTGVASTVVVGGSTVITGNIALGEAWVYGNSFVPGGPSTGAHQAGTSYSVTRPSSLVTSSGEYFMMPPPTYQEYSVSQVINVKTVSAYPVVGDGVTDDTTNLQAIVNEYAGCAILFFPSGAYLLSDTLTFPVGTRVWGENWPQITAKGSNFYNPAAPIPIVRVGNSGDVGVAQFSNILFTVADVLQGATLVEVNMAGSQPGDVGFWNCHTRVGGAMGSLVETNCGGTPEDCKAAYMMFHLTSTSSAYIENMWLWTADHDLDYNNATTVSTGRGMLVEATKATWLLGLASEHNTLYQTNFYNAENVFVGFQQSETAYWQGTGQSQIAPEPWSANLVASDPTFSWCASGDAQCGMGLFQYITGSSNLNFFGGGFWAWFDNDASCTNCQENGVYIENTSDFTFFGVLTRGVTTLVVNSGDWLVTQASNPGGWGGIVAAFLTDEA